jgi:hypothetical protein
MQPRGERSLARVRTSFNGLESRGPKVAKVARPSKLNCGDDRVSGVRMSEQDVRSCGGCRRKRWPDRNLFLLAQLPRFDERNRTRGGSAEPPRVSFFAGPLSLLPALLPGFPLRSAVCFAVSGAAASWVGPVVVVPAIVMVVIVVVVGSGGHPFRDRGGSVP